MQRSIDKVPPYQRAILKGHLVSCGVDYKDLDKPVIGVVNSWNEIVAGHVPLRGLAEPIKDGIRQAGGLPLEFNTIAMCDGIAQGHAGMRYSLPSRDLIADSVETMVLGHGIFDGLILMASCDKIVPGMLMAAARLDLPSLLFTGGPSANLIKPFESKQARQAFLQGEMSEEDLVAVTARYYSGPGICSYLGTANTMCMVAEALGLALPNTALLPAESDERRALAVEAGRLAVRLAAAGGPKPSRILTRSAFQDAIALVLGMGGSLNTVLHLPAIAHELGIDLTLDDWAEVSRRTPFLAAVTPNHNQRTVNDLQRAGGTPALLKELLPALHPERLVVTGQTLGQAVAAAEVTDREVIHPFTDPISPEGGVAVLHGNLAEDGAMIKRSAAGADFFRGPARVYNAEEAALAAAQSGEIQPGDTVVVRYEGPRGGPGMRELHRLTEVAAKIGNVAIITDGRFSGASSGVSIGYLAPEAADGGNIALVENGDSITIDVSRGTLTLDVPNDVLAERRARWQAEIKDAGGFLRWYAQSVGPAVKGAVRLDFGCGV